MHKHPPLAVPGHEPSAGARLGKDGVDGDCDGRVRAALSAAPEIGIVVVLGGQEAAQADATLLGRGGHKLAAVVKADLVVHESAKFTHSAFGRTRVSPSLPV